MTDPERLRIPTQDEIARQNEDNKKLNKLIDDLAWADGYEDWIESREDDDGRKQDNYSATEHDGRTDDASGACPF